jgi:hypothetical protein
MSVWLYSNNWVVSDSSSVGRRETSSENSETVGNTRDEWDWRPWWRRESNVDCGILALYTVMKLKNKDISINDIYKSTPVHPTLGSSIEDVLLQLEMEFLGRSG